jgi:endonuclease-3
MDECGIKPDFIAGCSMGSVVGGCYASGMRPADMLRIVDTIKMSQIADASIFPFNKKSIFVKEIANYLIEKCNSKVPEKRDILEKIPGVGRKTANVVLSELFNYPAIAVDTHVTRVSKRLKLAKEEDGVKEIEQKLMKKIKKDNWSRRHHQLVLFGRYYCKATKPECNNCKIRHICKKNNEK